MMVDDDDRRLTDVDVEEKDRLHGGMRWLKVVFLLDVAPPWTLPFIFKLPC